MKPADGSHTLTISPPTPGIPPLTIVVHGDTATAPLGETFAWSGTEFVSTSRALTLEWDDATHGSAAFGTPPQVVPFTST
jgi:hypothetical protein